ncbi:hypothetical protein B5F71_19580, partial [Bacteroides sp. An269]
MRCKGKSFFLSQQIFSKKFFLQLEKYFKGRVNQRVQHYEIFLKKTSAGVKKLSFSLGLALIFFL